jgi:hypothetical protein
MKHLKHLDLCKTQVTWACLPFLSSLISLTFFRLSRNLNRLPGSMSHNDDWTHLAQLERLDLSASKLTDADIANLQVLHKLQDLILHGNDKLVGTGLVHLQHIKLKNLNLRSCCGLRVLTGLLFQPNLASLNLALCSLRSTNFRSCLEGISGSLTTLNLQGTGVRDNDLTALLMLRTLSCLNLSHCSMLTAAAFDILEQFPYLSRLSIVGNPINTPSLTADVKHKYNFF